MISLKQCKRGLRVWLYNNAYKLKGTVWSSGNKYVQVEVDLKRIPNVRPPLISLMTALPEQLYHRKTKGKKR